MALGLGLRYRPVQYMGAPPLFLEATHGVAAGQTITCTVVNGSKYWIVWGDGSKTKQVGTGAPQVQNKAYGAAQAGTIRLLGLPTSFVNLSIPGQVWETVTTNLTTAANLTGIDLSDNALPAAQVLGLLNTVYDARAVLPATGTLALGGTNPATSYTGASRGLDCRAALPGWTTTWNFPVAVKLWCRSDLGVGLVGFDVDQWLNQAVAIHPVPTHSTRRPAFVTIGGPNNVPYIQVNGGNQCLQCDYVSTHPASRVVVASPQKTDHGGAETTTIDGKNGNRMRVGSSAVGAILITNPSPCHSWGHDPYLWHSVIGIYEHNNAKMWLDGTAQVLSRQDIGANDNTGIVIGQSGNTWGTANPDIAEVIDIEGVLTTDEVNEINTMLLNRYGVLPV